MTNRKILVARSKILVALIILYINCTRKRLYNYVTLHASKGTIEEQKQLETTQGTVIKLPMFSGDMLY